MRIRFRFVKQGKVRFTSQRDVARMWERGLRRAGLPLAYTEGFSPRPRLSFGLALPTGCESLAEYVDVVVEDSDPESAQLDPECLPARLNPLLPAGVDAVNAAVVDGGQGSLQEQVTSCSWVLWVRGIEPSALDERVSRLLAAKSLPIVRERKGRREQDDLRPSVLTLAAADELPSPGLAPGSMAAVTADLACQPRGVRPVELVRALMSVTGPSSDRSTANTVAVGGGTEGPVLDRACRTNQWIERDGRRVEPLGQPGATPVYERAEHVLERAS